MWPLMTRLRRLAEQHGPCGNGHFRRVYSQAAGKARTATECLKPWPQAVTTLDATSPIAPRAVVTRTCPPGRRKILMPWDGIAVEAHPARWFHVMSG